MKYLITGGCGFLGSNLASEVLKRGDELIILDKLFRSGTKDNLEWLKSQGNLKYCEIDVRNSDQINGIFSIEKPDVVFHVAGQVAMTTSLEDPRFDFETNALGSFNILSAVKDYCPETPILYSSTNKVYGDLEYLNYPETESRYSCKEFPEGLPEDVRLDFSTPYGCSKGAADSYMLDWARCFNLKTVVFRHSSIYGGRQFSTFDQGWIGWFVKQAIETKKGNLNEPFTISGNGKQVRDVLFSEDLVSCYFSAYENIESCKGNAYNIGGGIENSLSLLELFSFLESELDIKMNYKELPVRKSDQKFFVADVSKAKKDFKWAPKWSKEEGLRKMIDWVSSIED